MTYLTDELFTRTVAAAAHAFGTTPEAVVGRSRFRTVADARLALYAVLTSETRASLHEIAARLDRDHSTILQGADAARQKAQTDAEFGRALVAVRVACRG